MTYEKLRYLEQLLSSIYSNGIQKHREEIESYFKENYGEDSLVKPVLDKEDKKETTLKPSNKVNLNIPDDLEERLKSAVERVFKGG